MKNARYNIEINWYFIQFIVLEMNFTSHKSDKEKNKNLSNNNNNNNNRNNNNYNKRFQYRFNDSKNPKSYNGNTPNEQNHDQNFNKKKDYEYNKVWKLLLLVWGTVNIRSELFYENCSFKTWVLRVVFWRHLIWRMTGALRSALLSLLS